MQQLSVFIFFLFAFIVSAAQTPSFSLEAQPEAPDYSQEKNWSALPFQKDAADIIPSSETWVNDSVKEADVFFIYPTTYYHGETWNASIDDKKLNRRTDRKPVKYQASVFNQSCRVYVPRYRQAIIEAFEKSHQKDGEKALDLAYQDVKSAFEYYMEHYNQGRPIIIASHSQGTRHARKLMQEFFDTTALRHQLVAAYLVGFGITDSMYHNLKPCENGTQTGCYVTWASYKKGVEPGNSPLFGDVCVNPLSWSRDKVFEDSSHSKGAVLLNLNKKYPEACATQIHNHFLWVETKLPYVRSMKNLHIADYNLYWYDIRENVRQRIQSYFVSQHGSN
ncbi:MAG: DUF3089 domain-containing protein [Bacteroidetes bacterium]|nr:DUF3089 domain-containing protein [Bacteroidota bacterium]